MILWVGDLAQLSWVILVLVSPGVIHVVAVTWRLGRGWMNDPRELACWYWPSVETVSPHGLCPPGGQPKLLPLTVPGQQERESGNCKASGDLAAEHPQNQV